MISKSVLALLMIGCLVTGVVPAAAQQALPTRFAVVNFQKIFRESAATRSIAPQIAKVKKSFESQFKDLQKKLQAAEQDLQRQRTILSPEAFAEKQKAFKSQVSGVQRNVQSIQRMVGRAESDAYKAVRQAFHQITQEVAKERSLEVIFPRSGLIHVDPRYDISDEILKRLNKRLPYVTVQIEKEQNGQPAPSSRQKK